MVSFVSNSEFTIVLMEKNIAAHLCSVEALTIHEVEQLFCETPRLVSSEFENFAQAAMEEFAIPNPKNYFKTNMYFELMNYQNE